MKSIFDDASRHDLVARLGRMSAGSHPQWGKFSPGQMLRHLASPMKGAMGEMAVKDKEGTALLRTWLGRWFAIYSPIPWPKGLPTAPEFIPPADTDFDSARAELLDVVNRFGRGGRAMTLKPHPAFGVISHDDWGCLQWRHIDHHLRQFGL